ncbi:DUF4124 domain-containing protein [Shewanella sp. UCD-KL12]|uniref:DUF4124 domain-containing protein n=1 Tax=Shewanella sp. UCD-KL12 TaxID=1917163 RepID=UPI00097083C0|nr:DUF4124 domain-containing protein [Shewanella sp. UCD-KL12]
MARASNISVKRFPLPQLHIGIVTLSCLLFMLMSNSAHANSIYRCVKGEKIVFSQTICPKEFRQHKIEYELGITTETDSDKRERKTDPLQALLSKQTLSKEKLLSLVNSEIYRLNQEKSYFDILKASELQKIERKRYWEKKDKDDPSYLAEVEEMSLYFQELTDNNQQTVELLKARKAQIEEAPAELQEK